MNATSNERFWLLSWLIVPVISVWFAASYVVGEVNLPSWGGGNVPQVVTPAPQAYTWNGEGLVTLWFDDAFISQYTSAAPIVSAAGMTGALAVPTELLGTPGYMSWSQVQRLSYQGWDINAHTRTHSCTLDRADSQKQYDEIVGSQKDLAEHGLITQDFVTPCGVENDAMKEVAKSTFRSLRTSFPGDNPIPVQDPYRIQSYAIRNTTTLDEVKGWIEKAKAEKRWVILMFHGVDESGTEYVVLPNTLREMVTIVRDSGLQVVTPNQVLTIKSEVK